MQRIQACILFGGLAILASCNKAPVVHEATSALRPLNIVLITIDTLRSDRLGCYGSKDVETPNLDRLASRGTVFENAIAQSPLTAPSHASIMTGLYPTVHKVRDTGNFVLSGSHATLAQTVQRAGWGTAAFIGASVLKKRFGFYHGFASYDDEMVGPERRASDVIDRALRWLEAQSGKQFFLWVHVFDPHFPYDPPSPFREKYTGRPYDGEVSYTDQQVGRLLDAIAKKAPTERTIVAVLADHGESFSEHGEYAHGVFLYDTTVRIPFLLAGPGVPAGRRVKQQVSTIDVFPTMLDLIGGKPPTEVQGASLVPALAREEDRPTFTYLETVFPKINMGWAELRGMRTTRWKFIRAPRPELYDLSKDPGESTNIIGSHASEARELESMLEKVTGGTGTRQPETVETAVVDQRTLQELKTLGYLGGSSPGEYSLSGKGVDPKDRVDVLGLLHAATEGAPSLTAVRRIELLRRALSIDPSNPALYSNLGDIYRAAGRRDDEMKLYVDAVKRGVRNAWLYSRLGALYLRRGNKQEAVTFLEGAARANPADLDSLQNLGVVYRETGRLADAERVLRSVIASGEHHAPAYNELGMTLFQMGDRTAARTYFEKAAGIDPAYLLNLARLYKMEGDRERARTSFEAFLAGPAERPEYRQLIPQVRRELAAVQ